MSRYFAFALLALAPVGCFNNSESGGVALDPAPESRTEHLPAPAAQFHDRLLEIAESYEGYQYVDYQVYMVGTGCETNGALSRSYRDVKWSASGDDATHGKKLYFAFSNHGKIRPSMAGKGKGNSYLPDEGEANQVGKVVVKEAWLPEKVEDAGDPLPSVPRKIKFRVTDKNGAEHFEERTIYYTPYAGKNGHHYRAARKTGLFIMYKMDPATPGTDEGWVYGTVTADGKEVTGAGRLENCMKCHMEAPHDRLFGPPAK
jgi:hypothetical protein